MKLITPTSVLEVVNELAYTFGSTDNTRTYPISKNLGESSRPSSVHGVLINGEPVIVIGADGGVSGVHANSGIVLDGMLYLAVGDSVIGLRLNPVEQAWALQIDDATCFGVYVNLERKALISHGELSISRFTADGKISWQAYGQDIFSEALTLHQNSIEALDFNGRTYQFNYDNGQSDA
jgi:hypothetical protein